VVEEAANADWSEEEVDCEAKAEDDKDVFLCIWFFCLLRAMIVTCCTVALAGEEARTSTTRSLVWQAC